MSHINQKIIQKILSHDVPTFSNYNQKQTFYSHFKNLFSQTKIHQKSKHTIINWASFLNICLRIAQPYILHWMFIDLFIS